MRIILSACLVLAGAASVDAQEVLQGVTFSADLLNLTTVGTDIDQVQVFTLNQTADARGTFTQRATTLDYGTTFRRVDMRVGDSRALSLSAGYRRGNWGISFRRWSTDEETSFQERITSSPETLTSSALAFTQSQTVQGCRMWDNTQPPVVNMRDVSGFSPVDCYARNALETSKMDIMLERAWIESPGLLAVVRIGAAIGHVEHRRQEGQEQNAFVEFPGIPGPLGTPLDRLTNRITLDSTGAATGRFVGPNVELAGRFGFGRLQADWRVNTSVLIGDAELTGEWIDIDRVSIVGRAANVSFTQSDMLEGHYPLSEKKQSAIPVLDTEVKVGYRILETISVGVGYFISSWQSVPMASSWSVPGEWTDAAGTHWKRNESDLVFHGVTFFGQVSF